MDTHLVTGIICTVVGSLIGWLGGGIKLYGDARSVATDHAARLLALEKLTADNVISSQGTRLTVLEDKLSDIRRELADLRDMPRDLADIKRMLEAHNK